MPGIASIFFYWLGEVIQVNLLQYTLDEAIISFQKALKFHKCTPMILLLKEMVIGDLEKHVSGSISFRRLKLHILRP